MEQSVIGVFCNLAEINPSSSLRWICHICLQNCGVYNTVCACNFLGDDFNHGATYPISMTQLCLKNCWTQDIEKHLSWGMYIPYIGEAEMILIWLLESWSHHVCHKVLCKAFFYCQILDGDEDYADLGVSVVSLISSFGYMMYR